MNGNALHARLALLAAVSLLVPALGAAQERPTIVVGSPDFRPLPIAVASFQGEAEAEGAASTVTEVVRGDLALTGLFEVLDPKGFLADPGEGLAAPSIRFSRWADVGAEALAKARIRLVGRELEGELHVYEVRAGRESLAKTRRTAASDPRALGHRLADEIVHLFTREPGVFGTRIAAIRKGRGLFELLLLDVDGKNPRVLASERAILLSPSWRPDGKEILVTSYRSGRPEVWGVRVSDGAFRRVVPVANALGGAFSPDGSRVAFTVSDRGDTDVWVVQANGSGARRLTRDPAIDVSPSWSPDGKQLAFVSDRAGTPQLYLMDANGGSQRRITFQGNYNQTPAFSPRGDLIAFTARDERKVFDVFVVAPATGRIDRVTQDQGRTNEEPSFAPNGRLMVFRTDRNGVGELVISDVKGERQTVIGRGLGDLSEPAWGPLLD